MMMIITTIIVIVIITPCDTSGWPTFCACSYPSM